MSPSAISVTPPQEIQLALDLKAATVAQELADTASVQVKPLNGVTPLQTLDASKLIFTRTTTPRPVLDFADQRIKPTSSVCTDHMVTAVWHAESGWSAPELKPYGPLSLMPTASVLHYATECFEGLKVYRGYDGKLRLFRPDCNARRLLMSSLRISLPGFDPREVEKLIIALMAVDGPRFLPKSQPGTMLYLRPAVIGTDPSLGVKVPNEAMLLIIACYFADLSALCAKGMRLMASKNDEVRAWPGGFGFAKVGANYGPSLAATVEAKSKGYHQVLWLLGDDGVVTEAGASNFCVVWRSYEGKLQLVTAPLEGKIILDGVTRRSVLELAKERLADSRFLEALEVVERKFTMDEVAIAVEEGRMVEAFACGTAYFITPVCDIHYGGKDLQIPMARGSSGEYAFLFKSWLRNIMYGKEEHEWGVIIEEKESVYITNTPTALPNLN